MEVKVRIGNCVMLGWAAASMGIVVADGQTGDGQFAANGRWLT